MKLTLEQAINSSTLSTNSALNGGGLLLYHRERVSISYVQEAVWAPGPVWTGILAATGIRSTGRQARIE